MDAGELRYECLELDESLDLVLTGEFGYDLSGEFGYYLSGEFGSDLALDYFSATP